MRSECFWRRLRGIQSDSVSAVACACLWRADGVLASRQLQAWAYSMRFPWSKRSIHVYLPGCCKQSRWSTGLGKPSKHRALNILFQSW